MSKLNILEKKTQIIFLEFKFMLNICKMNSGRVRKPLLFSYHKCKAHAANEGTKLHCVYQY